MGKLGKILLLILNFCVDTFLVAVAFFLVLWLIFGITPRQSVQSGILWVEQKWDALLGRKPVEEIPQLSSKYKKRAHRNLYVQEQNKKDENQAGPIGQPYKYE